MRDEEDVRELAGTGAEEVDVAGGVLAPGFQDVHVHPIAYDGAEVLTLTEHAPS